MKLIRITLKQEPRVWIDEPLAEGNTFPQFVGNVIAAGYFMNHTAYLPVASIASMLLIEVQDGERPMDFTKARAMQ